MSPAIKMMSDNIVAMAGAKAWRSKGKRKRAKLEREISRCQSEMSQDSDKKKAFYLRVLYSEEKENGEAATTDIEEETRAGYKKAAAPDVQGGHAAAKGSETKRGKIFPETQSANCGRTSVPENK